MLANAPAALHKLVREKVVSSTLAIKEIRAHGGDKVLQSVLHDPVFGKLSICNIKAVHTALTPHSNVLDVGLTSRTDARA